MLSETDATHAMGATAYDVNGEKIGKVGQIFLDDQTGQPEFLTVNTGLFGTSESFVPAQGAALDGDRVNVDQTKAFIKDAPKVDIDSGHLDQAEEGRLYDYYSMSGYTSRGDDTQSMPPVAAASPDRGDRDGLDDLGRSSDNDPQYATTGDRATGDMAAAPAGHDTSGPTTDDSMTRSEEHLEAGTQTREAGKTRLRKYVTTDTESVTVPVRKERAVVESEPITDANVGAAGDGPAISEEEHEVVLHEERAVGQAVATPVERVRLGTETVTEQETVTGEVRKENIEVDGDDRDGGNTTGDRR